MFKGTIKVFLLLVLQSNIVFAQRDSTRKKSWVKDDIAFYYSLYKGQVVKNYKTDIPVADSYYNELSVMWQMDGSKTWHSSFRYPLTGVAINHARFGNDSILGSAIGVFPHWIFQGRKGKKLQYNIRLGAGLAYFTKIYDRQTNIENEVISSRITNITTFAASLSYKLTPHFSAYAGVSLFHYSNGHTSIPNLGLNDHPYTFGISYKPQVTTLLPRPTSLDYDKSIHFNVRIGRGVHEMARSIFPVNGPSFPVYNFALFLSKQVSPVNDLHLGFYTTYYSGFYNFMLLEQTFQGEERKHSFVYSVFGGHEFLVGHFGFTQELVVNVWNPFYEELYFNRDYVQEDQSSRITIYLGLRLQFDYYPFKPAADHRNNFYLGANLKTIVSKADYVELHIGYTL